jgi:hypothetical protein
MAKIIETHTLWGREHTAEEKVKLQERRDQLIAQGIPILRSGTFNGVYIREHATEELANSHIEFSNSFNPPPLKSEVVTYEDE